MRRLTTNSLLNVNVVNAAGFTPLMLAVQQDKTDLVDAVMAGKPDVNVVNQVGVLPMSRACSPYE